MPLRHSFSYSPSLPSLPPPPTHTYTLSLHDALPICAGIADGERRPDRHPSGSGLGADRDSPVCARRSPAQTGLSRSEEHTSELQSLRHLVCRLLLEKKNI